MTGAGLSAEEAIAAGGVGRPSAVRSPVGTPVAVHDLPATMPDAARGLTTTERLLLGQDDPARPMVIRVRLRFDRPLPIDAVRQAAAAVTPRHPLLTARLRDGRWVHTPGDPPVIDADAESAEGAGGLPIPPIPVPPIPVPPIPVPPIDVRTEPALRLTCRGEVVDLDFHHAAADGQGARQWAVDFFLALDALLCGTRASLPRLDPELLAARGDLSQPAGLEPIGPSEGLRNLWLTVRGRTARLRGGRPGERVWEHRFSPAETAALRAGLSDRGLTMNDQGLITTLTALAETPGLSGGRLTVLNPVDIRRPRDLRMPAANRLGFAYVRRLRRELGKDLVRSVRDDLRYVKDRYVGAEFFRGVQLVENVPGVIDMFRRLGRFVPTAQFTCLGDSTRGRRLGLRREGGDVLIGEGRLTSISGFAPLAPGVPLSLAACETANVLTLTVRSKLSEEETRAFGERWRHQFAETAGPGLEDHAGVN